MEAAECLITLCLSVYVILNMSHLTLQNNVFIAFYLYTVQMFACILKRQDKDNQKLFLKLLFLRLSVHC